MDYLYHLAGKDMRGTVLYPLNQLKIALPDVYAEEAKKYQGREETMDQQIPILNCLWNDVLHFTAVPPTKLRDALLEAGRPAPFHGTFFKIDPTLLDPAQTIVYLFKDMNEKMSEENFTRYDPNDLRAYADLSEATTTYYKRCYATHERPLLFVHVPHILYKGTLDTRDIPRITI
jgi:hypothetical protein